MNFCDNSLTLSIIMYFKYIIIFSFIVFIILFIKTKENIIKRIMKILFIIIILYTLLALILIFTKTSYKSCITNSNFININKYKILNFAYKNKSDELINIDNLKPTDVIGSKKIKVYNQNVYPLSSYKFNLHDSKKEYSFKKSGNEISIFSSMLSGFKIGDELDPIEIIRLLKSKEIPNLNMNTILNSFTNDYNYIYRKISLEEIYDVIDDNGLVILKIHANSGSANTITCSDSYILIYSIDQHGSYRIITSNDKDYDYICPPNTKGFGSIVQKNINGSSIYAMDITDYIYPDEIYAVWR